MLTKRCTDVVAILLVAAFAASAGWYAALHAVPRAPLVHQAPLCQPARRLDTVKPPPRRPFDLDCLPPELQPREKNANWDGICHKEWGDLDYELVPAEKLMGHVLDNRYTFVVPFFDEGDYDDTGPAPLFVVTHWMVDGVKQPLAALKGDKDALPTDDDDRVIIRTLAAASKEGRASGATAALLQAARQAEEAVGEAGVLSSALGGPTTDEFFDRMRLIGDSDGPMDRECGRNSCARCRCRADDCCTWRSDCRSRPVCQGGLQGRSQEASFD